MEPMLVTGAGGQWIMALPLPQAPQDPRLSLALPTHLTPGHSPIPGIWLHALHGSHPQWDPWHGWAGVQWSWVQQQ